MENILIVFMMLSFIAIIADVILKVIDRLYLIHSDLLINEPWLGKLSIKRLITIYCILLAIGILLVSKNFAPLILMVNILFSLLLVIVIMTDYEQRLIFDRILLGIGIVALVSSGLFDISIIDRLLGALVGGVSMFILAILMKGTLGFGDIKLVFFLGFWQGIDNLTTILLSGFLGGGLAALLLLITGIKKRHDFFAYGPYFVIGALLNMLGGNI